MNTPIRMALVAAALSCASAAAAQTVYYGAGAATTTSVTDFRTALGALNANVPGSFGSGRREINWDGVPHAFAAPNNLPANFFNVTSPRGVVLSTPTGDVTNSSRPCPWRIVRQA